MVCAASDLSSVNEKWYIYVYDYILSKHENFLVSYRIWKKNWNLVICMDW